MSWTVEGNYEGLRLGLSGSGSPSIEGCTHNHTVDPAGGDINSQFYERLGRALCCWSIHPSTASEQDLDPAGSGFFGMIQQSPDKPKASIGFYEKPDMVSVTVALPAMAFENALAMFKDVLVCKALAYTIGLDFTGFSVPAADTAKPTVEQFLQGAGRSVSICDEVTFSITRQQEVTDDD